MTADKNKVSVVLCTYNGSSYLKKQLNSILEQTYDIDEIVIVDDCSTDSTRDILREYQKDNNKIKLFFNEKNLGSNSSFRYAISLASNNYLALCDQDDIWYKNKIEIQMNSVFSSGFEHDNKPLLVFHDLCLIDQNDNITNKSFWKLRKFIPETFTFKRLLFLNIVTGCTCLINNSLKEEMLKSDMQDIIMHDYLIALIGYGFGNAIYINEPLMYYRSHQGTVTEKENITFTNRIKIFISSIKEKSYLKPNILQIQQFNFLYGDKLDLPNKKLVQYFESLKNKSIVRRIIYKWLIN
ncbi:glycosyltransferase family 2 protein [Flavobacterium sp. MR2016-29]|uniref:glycosyltransferase family 2 protein n=1 Tax=Flavobacterium sp. MR2016-29 TaxID=2783795 RepID=UPI00188DBF3F|nr:glycosyltransferase family 2 protein [Flavobacterium sp. MR2016-29]MBF4492904.1 glycosyltransferase family 2 protein [Flavobacterium sp. MR2016-29]